jgi:hypothetical protein
MLVIDLRRFLEKLEQFLSVYESLVDLAVDRAKHVQGTIELSEVGNEEDEIGSGAETIGNTKSNNAGTDKKTNRL